MSVDPPAYASALDADAIERLRALDPDGANGLLERLLGTYRGSLQRLLPQLQTGRAAGDAEAVRYVAHTLKSSSASVGALRLAHLCTHIEAALRQGEPLAALAAQLDELVAEGQRLVGVLPELARR